MKDAPTNVVDMMLLHAAAAGDQFKAIKLLEAGAALNARDYNERTPLHLAAERNHVQVAMLLVGKGADLDVVDEMGYSPLELAVHNCSTDVADYLRTAFSRPASCRPGRRCSISGVVPPCDRIWHRCHVPSSTIVMPEVSVAFLKLCEFDSVQTTNPNIASSLVSRIHSQLALLARQTGVQIIDTVDACVIAATNCDGDQHDDHAIVLARFVLSALGIASMVPIDPDRPELGRATLRAGLHCGSVAAGLVGSPASGKHTLVGDCVNVASRMQSQGARGRAQCTEGFASRLSQQLDARPPCSPGGLGASRPPLALCPRDGPLDVKGKGPMPTFWLEQAAARGHPPLAGPAAPPRRPCARDIELTAADLPHAASLDDGPDAPALPMRAGPRPRPDTNNQAPSVDARAGGGCSVDDYPRWRHDARSGSKDDGQPLAPSPLDADARPPRRSAVGAVGAAEAGSIAVLV